MTYKNVYFRIKTEAYDFNCSWTKEQAEEFDNEARNIFVLDGWDIKESRSNSGCTTVIKDKQHLYLHPQSFSGEILEDNVQYIEQLLQSAKTFKHYHTDIYETRHDLTNDEYRKILNEHKKEITKDILEAFRTKRSNLYYSSSYSLLTKVIGEYSVMMLGFGYQDGFPVSYASEIFEDLIKQGYIVVSNIRSGEGYRTINKTEQKELGLKIA